MKKILALVAGAAIIGSTVTACAQINGDASNASKAVISTLFGKTDDAKNCESLSDAAGVEAALETQYVVLTKETCEQIYTENKAKDLKLTISNTFVAKDSDEKYNVGLVFKAEETNGKSYTYDAFVYFNASNYSKITKVEITRR